MDDCRDVDEVKVTNQRNK